MKSIRYSSKKPSYQKRPQPPRGYDMIVDESTGKISLMPNEEAELIKETFIRYVNETNDSDQ